MFDRYLKFNTSKAALLLSLQILLHSQPLPSQLMVSSACQGFRLKTLATCFIPLYPSSLHVLCHENSFLAPSSNYRQYLTASHSTYCPSLVGAINSRLHHCGDLTTLPAFTLGSRGSILNIVARLNVLK